MISAVPIQQPAPWEAVPAQEQLFVLITGANSGIGLGIAQRLIDEFIATRSLSSHITIIPTARSASKCLQTIRTLRAYATQTAQTSEVLKVRTGGESEYNWKDTVARIHVLSLSLELCDLRNIYAFADALCNGTVSNPEGLEGEYLRNVRVPRIDSVIFNAAFGGWSGVNYPRAIWSVLSKGIIETATYPDFKTALATGILNEDSRLNYPEKPLLAEVFCACVFGHYVLAHQLLPLLSRRKDDIVAPGRIIWSSSIEAHAKAFQATDMQCFTRSFSYESAKRLTDLLVLTWTLPAAKPYSKSFLTIGGRLDDSGSDTTEDDDIVPPNMYLTHPGVVASTLFPLPWFLFWAYELVVSMARWLGSPWHLTSGYMGGRSASWVALQEQSELDSMQATHLKLGSSCDRELKEYVKPTEVEGWGWNGKVENSASDATPGVLNKLSGRKQGAKDATEEDIVKFEEEGAYCWAEMEKLRLQWEDILSEEGI